MEKRRLHIVAFALSLLVLCAGCASDNVHMPEPDLTPAPKQYDGISSSGIPIFPSFVPQSSANYAVVTWLNEELTAMNLEMGSFSVDIAEVQMHIEIGNMLIQNVPCQKTSDDCYEFALDEFSCQAGAYYTTGSLQGSLDKDQLTFTLLYRPGSMPFDVETIFTSD